MKLYSIKPVFWITGIVLITLSISSCTRIKGRTSTNRAARERIATSLMPEKKIDTVYMLVPTEPDVPNEIPFREGDVIIPTTKKLKAVVHSANLPKPPQIDFKRPSGIHTRNEYIEYFNIEGAMRDLIIACDYDNPTVRNNSVALVALSPGNFNLGQVCDIFDFCYSNWSYVNDPISREYFAKASETIKNGLNGDCDDFAILICSMILSIGGETRINFAYDDTGGHAFAEVNIGKTDIKKVHSYLAARYGPIDMSYKKDQSDNCWLNLDWQGKYPGAKYWQYKRGICFNIIRNEKFNLQAS